MKKPRCSAMAMLLFKLMNKRFFGRSVLQPLRSAFALKFRLHRLIALSGSALLMLFGCVAPLRHPCSSCTPIELAIASPLSPLSALSLNHHADNEQRLHIYLEGDGRPWTPWNRPSTNPNSRALTALQLMQQDWHHSVYLNRPCYGLALMASACTHELWTSGRYSETVVDAMNQGLNQLQKHYPDRQLILIGHSGGGSLAMLLAQRRTDVMAVITVAANLDHRAWTDSHRYLPLTQSLNAADVTLPPNVIRWHLAGRKDQQVPLNIIKNAVTLDSSAVFTVYENFDHQCCWADVWPTLLAEVNERLAKVDAAGTPSSGNAQ